MRRLSVTLLATTFVSLAAAQPSSAASAKAIADDNCAIAKGEATMVIKTALAMGEPRFAELAAVPVYRVHRTHLLPRPEVALHRHVSPMVTPALLQQPVLALAIKDKVTLSYSDNAKAKHGKRAGLAAVTDGGEAPVLNGPLVSAYA